MLLLWMASADAEPITFADTLRLAADAPQVDAVRATTAEQVALARREGTWLDDPEVEGEQIVDETELRAALGVPLAGQPVARATVASRARTAAEIGGELDRVQTVLAVGQAYLDAQRAAELAALLADTATLAVRARDAARALRASGELGSVDAAVAAGAAARAAVDVSAARQEALRTGLVLEALLGRAPTGDLQPAGWPAIPEPVERDPATLPAPSAASARAAAAKTRATLAALDLLPTPTVSAGWRAGPAPGPIWGVGVELPIFGPGLSTLGAERAARDAALARAEASRLEAAAAWTTAHAAVEAAQANVEATRVEGLDRALADLGAAFAAGEYSLTDYVTRRDAVIDGLEAAIDARFALESARLRLWTLAGEVPQEGSP